MLNRARLFLVDVLDRLGDRLDRQANAPADPEAVACAELVLALEGLTLEQRDRALRWAQQRYVVDDEPMKQLYAEREIRASARRHAIVRAEMQFRAEIAELYAGPFDELGGPGTSH